MLNRETQMKQYQEQQKQLRLEEEAKEKERLLEEERAKRTIEVGEDDFAPYMPGGDPLEEAKNEEAAASQEAADFEARMNEAKRRAAEAGKVRRELEKQKKREEKRTLGAVTRTDRGARPLGHIVNILLSVALFLALAFTGLQYLAGSGRISLPGMMPRAQEQAQLDINGETYTVPLADLTLAEGESKIIIYGLTVYEQDGEVHHKAMPLGEYELADGQMGK